MPNQYDPYRNAVRHSIEGKVNNKRKQLFIQQQTKAKAKKFFEKKIYLSDLVDLPSGLANGIFIALFIFIPYSIGVVFTFIFLAKASFTTYDHIENSFAFSWVIGYEFLATFLLLMIFQSAMRFR